MICDRGGIQFRKPLEIHRLDPKKIDLAAIQLLLTTRNQKAEESYKSLRETLPKALGFTQTANEIALENLIAISEQIVGNCSWASNEGIVKAFLFLDRLKANSFKVDESSKILKLILEPVYDSWLIYQQILLLDKYLAAPEKRCWVNEEKF